MEPTLKVGLVGYGYAGKVFHAPLIAGVPGLHLTAIASSGSAKVQADWPAVAVEASPAYFAGIRAAVLGTGANPVPPAEAVQVMTLIELGLRSAAERREQAVTP